MKWLMRWCVPDSAWRGWSRERITIAFWEREMFRLSGCDCHSEVYVP